MFAMEVDGVGGGCLREGERKGVYIVHVVCKHYRTCRVSRAEERAEKGHMCVRTFPHSL